MRSSTRRCLAISCMTRCNCWVKTRWHAAKIASEIEEFLIRSLHEVAAARFGPNPPSAVLIQIEQAEQRLQAFAPKQAERAAAGWEIRLTEKGVGYR